MAFGGLHAGVPQLLGCVLFSTCFGHVICSFGAQVVEPEFLDVCGQPGVAGLFSLGRCGRAGFLKGGAHHLFAHGFAVLVDQPRCGVELVALLAQLNPFDHCGQHAFDDEAQRCARLALLDDFGLVLVSQVGKGLLRAAQWLCGKLQ